MKRRNPIFRFIMLLMLAGAMLTFCASCKSEGEKLAEEGIQALHEESLADLVNYQFRYNSLSQKEKERADAYMAEHEPQARVKIMQLIEKRLKGLKLKIK